MGSLVFGFAFNGLTRFLHSETEGAWIVAVLAVLSLTFGVAGWLGVVELLATMTAGGVVANYSQRQEKVFRLRERYREELVFVLSGKHPDFSVLSHDLLPVVALVFFRLTGKVPGAVAGGLIPQGGIVVGPAPPDGAAAGTHRYPLYHYRRGGAMLSYLPYHGHDMAVIEKSLFPRDEGPVMDVSGAFLRYEKRMRPSIEEKQKAGRNMARWSVPDSRIRIGIRNLVMRTAGLPVTTALLRDVSGAGSSIEP